METTTVSEAASTPIGLSNLPAEILQEIATFVLSAHSPTEDARQRTEDDRQHFCEAHAAHADDGSRVDNNRRDVLAMSSCSKWMRQNLFAYNVLRDLVIKPCQRDVAMIKSLSVENRNCVR
jgi:hypothetical protein